MKCTYYQWRISQAIDEPTRPLPRRHMDSCAKCRRFHESSLRMQARLSGRMTALSGLPPTQPKDDEATTEAQRSQRERSFLLGPVVSSGSRAAASPRRHSRGWLYAGAAAAAVVVLVLVIQSADKPGAQNPIVQSPAPAPAVPDDRAVPDRRAPDGDAPPVPLAGLPTRQEAIASMTQIAAAPVKAELEKVTNDARAAANTVLALVPFDIPRAGADDQ